MLRLSNADARKLWLNTTGLAQTPTGPVDVMALIRRMGFLQIDTIRNVSRAHHHILWSRNQNYREKMLWPRLGETGDLFEHFTHDASLIPMEYYPMWGMQFDRLGKRVAKWYQPGLARDAVRAVYDRIAADGPLSTHAFDTKVEGERKMWARPPHKKALDMMWYQGKLATSHRQNFTKFYDLGERVFPVELRAEKHSEQAQTDWLCTQALERLSFASVGEIKRFWDVLSAQEVKDWLNGREGVLRVEVEGVDGKMHFAFAPTDIEKILEKRIGQHLVCASSIRLILQFGIVVACSACSGLNIAMKCLYQKPSASGAIMFIPYLRGPGLWGGLKLRLSATKGKCISPGSGRSRG